jgi:hypothetical protein
MELPIELKNSINNNAFCAISTHLANQQIQTHLMWIDFEENYLLINTEKDRKKTENIRTNSNISVVIFHPSAMYSSWEVRGVVEHIVETKEANDHIDKLSIRYTGKPYKREINETWEEKNIKSREIWKIKPLKILSMVRPQAKSESE